MLPCKECSPEMVYACSHEFADDPPPCASTGGSANTTTNPGSPKLLDEMEQFAVACDRAGNGKDARLVRSWVKQLRASA